MADRIDCNQQQALCQEVRELLLKGATYDGKPIWDGKPIKDTVLVIAPEFNKKLAIFDRLSPKEQEKQGPSAIPLSYTDDKIWLHTPLAFTDLKAPYSEATFNRAVAMIRNAK